MWSNICKEVRAVVHEGIRKHKCVHCGKAFGQAGKLRIHVTTVHEGLKNYKCTFYGIWAI